MNAQTFHTIVHSSRTLSPHKKYMYSSNVSISVVALHPSRHAYMHVHVHTHGTKLTLLSFPPHMHVSQHHHSTHHPSLLPLFIHPIHHPLPSIPSHFFSPSLPPAHLAQTSPQHRISAPLLSLSVRPPLQTTSNVGLRREI